ncbi:MAG: sigma 54-interacting transcriptional regulator [Candidatus Poribacteria bacterium]
MKLKSEWNNRILVVDDKENIHQDFEETLNPDIHKVITDDLVKAFGSTTDESFLPDIKILHARSGKEAFDQVRQSLEKNEPIAVAYIDMRMPPGWDGAETMRKVRQIDKNIEIVIMTAHTDKPLSEIVKDMDLLDKLLYIRKPFAREEIQQMTISLIEKWNINIEAERNRQRLEAVLNSTSDAIVMFDLYGNSLFANKHYLDMFDIDEENIHDKTVYDMKNRFQEPSKFVKSQEVFFSNPESAFEDIIEAKIPKRKIFYLYTAPVFNLNESVVGRIMVYRDVSKEIEIDQMKAELLRLRAELEAEYSYDKIIGNSKNIREVFTLVHQASQSEITVLIQGETGTGKELVARAIHYNSPRKNGPFVPVNCAAIPETLIESELFGHEKGAFTGAVSRKIGRFEQASGGTILLDEIGEMHPSLQVKLLRVLQEREIQRVGGIAIIPIDVRIVASTNMDLESAIKAGKFREDLFYRISVFPIVIPPLRERVEDIPMLAEHFLNKFSIKTGKLISVISNEAMDLLINYHWPGNIRELESAIERGVLLENSEVLQYENLPQAILLTINKPKTKINNYEDKNGDEILPLDEIEKKALSNALKITGNNIQKAAKALGINRATVYRKLEKYKLLDTKLLNDN